MPENEPLANLTGFDRVCHALAERRHRQAPIWLQDSARTAQQAADALGVVVGQIAKSVVFRGPSPGTGVVIIMAGDKRVDERKVSALLGQSLKRADAEFVKSHTGFSIGGVSPLGFLPEAGLPPPRVLIDASLQRFDRIWAAAGHPHGVFSLTPDELSALTGENWVDVSA